MHAPFVVAVALQGRNACTGRTLEHRSTPEECTVRLMPRRLVICAMAVGMLFVCTFYILDFPTSCAGYQCDPECAAVPLTPRVDHNRLSACQYYSFRKLSVCDKDLCDKDMINLQHPFLVLVPLSQALLMTLRHRRFGRSPESSDRILILADVDPLRPLVYSGVRGSRCPEAAVLHDADGQSYASCGIILPP